MPSEDNIAKFAAVTSIQHCCEQSRKGTSLTIDDCVWLRRSRQESPHQPSLG